MPQHTTVSVPVELAEEIKAKLEQGTLARKGHRSVSETMVYATRRYLEALEAGADS